MSTLKVEVDADHLARLIKSPLIGLVELVWNSIDADAASIALRAIDDDLGGWQSLVVEDDGSGITREQADLYFGRVGGSWKKTSRTSPGGRTLHGQAGQGRWAAFGIGETVRWTSVAQQVTGSRARIKITGRRGQLTEFEVSDLEQPDPDQADGTLVEIFELSDAAKKLIDSDPYEDLVMVFALALQEYPIELTWQGRRVDPSALQAHRHVAPLTVEGADGAELVIIEWNQLRPENRALHLCDASGVTLHTTLAGIHAPGYVFSAYIRWDGFQDHINDMSLGDLAVEPVGELIDAAKTEMRRYFGDRSKQRGTELITAWKADQTYPYEGEAPTPADRAERELFDLVAVTASDVIEPMEARSRRLSLRLMREALEKSPASLHDVLQEVLDLPKERVDELKSLLARTSLSNLISSARRITDRLDFLVGLEELVNDPQNQKQVLERSQLHRILVSETWLFREEYALTADDVTLRSALRQHTKLLGREDLAPEEVDASEVVDDEGRRVVVDLALSEIPEMMIGRVIEQHQNRREHLVIELKRPSVHIGFDQVRQIHNYARTVAEDGRFDMARTTWEFWIVGDRLDKETEGWATQKNRERGVIYEPGDLPITVRAVTWAQIINDARHRLSFVRESLSYSPSAEQAMSYLNRAHGKYLPSRLRDTQQDSAA